MNEKRLTVTGFVDDAGFFSVDDREDFRQRVKKFAGHEVIVTVKKKPHRQGTQAMRYYRGVVIPAIAEACGYRDPDDYPDIHDAMAWKFLRLDDGPFGTPRRRSTSKDDMSAEDFSEYLDRVITYAESNIPGCTIPRPNEVDEADYQAWQASA